MGSLATAAAATAGTTTAGMSAAAATTTNTTTTARLRGAGTRATDGPEGVGTTTGTEAEEGAAVEGSAGEVAGGAEVNGARPAMTTGMPHLPSACSTMTNASSGIAGAEARRGTPEGSGMSSSSDSRFFGSSSNIFSFIIGRKTTSFTRVAPAGAGPLQDRLPSFVVRQATGSDRFGHHATNAFAAATAASRPSTLFPCPCATPFLPPPPLPSMGPQHASSHPLTSTVPASLGTET